MKKILNPYLNKEGYNCVCCAPNNPVGLHLEFWEEGEDVLTIWNPGENYQGWINTLHGGIISMLMDEVAGWVINRKLQTTGVTMQLNVKYKKPVMTTDSQITVRGRIASQRRNIVTIHLTLENSKGEVCDEGEAIYFTFGPDKAKEMGFDCCKVEGRNNSPLMMRNLIKEAFLMKTSFYEVFYDAAAAFLLKSQIDRMTIAMLTRLRPPSIIGVLAM